VGVLLEKYEKKNVFFLFIMAGDEDLPLLHFKKHLRIPGHADHPFRAKPITDSGSSRSPIPIEADHRFRSMPISWHALIILSRAK